MTNQNNPSLNVAFILPETLNEKRPANKFGSLSQNKAIAFDPETTGASILAEANVLRQVADERDLANFQQVFADDDVEPESKIVETISKAPHENAETEIQYERIIDLPDYLPAWFFEVGAQRAKAVCKIEASGVDYQGNGGSWSGTGFLISPNILLTNHHVLNSKEVASKAVCIFNYETDEAGRVQKTDTYTLDPNQLFTTSPARDGLDFTACWIESEAAEKYGFVPVYRHSFAIKNIDCANIVQHPDGRHKAIVVQKNEIYDQSDIAVLYTSDTEPGSSGAFVCNNSWKLVALHHASRKLKEAIPEENRKALYMNEGIKMAAIATYLESLTDADQNYSAARRVLDAFNGVDSAMGYFGSLGRQTSANNLESDLEIVRNGYRGEDKDVDLCFWNIEWFNKNYKQKLKDVAWEISIQNLDVWVLSESSPEAAQALVAFLKAQYNLDYSYAASEPTAPSSKQTTTVVWNTKTVSVKRKDWPAKVNTWLTLNSADFNDLTELQQELELEAVDGKIFDRYPGLFEVEAISDLSKNAAFKFNLVPLHLKAMAEGSKRRRFACRILAQAIDYCIKQAGMEEEWVLGGDLNATIASGDLEELSVGKLVALSATDAEAQAFSYLKKPYQSLIDHIYISPNLIQRTDKDGFIILARERDLTRDGNSKSDYLSISDHRPVMVRLSLIAEQQHEKDTAENAGVTRDAARELAVLIRQTASGSGSENEQPISEVTATREGALAIVAESRTRTYYDKDKDEKDKATYYGSMPGENDGDKLFQLLHEKVKSTHTTPLAYKPALYVYPWVDLHENMELVHLYNGDSVNPESLIEADFAIEESELETNAIFNCEHVVPQSWFNKQNPQRGDLHHLFACTPNCNSFRGNMPYVEFIDWEEKTMGECGKREVEGFEPKRAKGIVARATLYFMLRYPEIKVRYNRTAVQSLLAWHLEEPPSDYERHRNVAIQELQGNRNPFIDFPRLAVRINFKI